MGVLLVPVLEVLVVLLLLDTQLTAEVRVTPDAAQSCCAKVIALCWSAVLHIAVRQHAIPDKNVGFEQMHFTSALLQPPILLPLVDWDTQDCFASLLARQPKRELLRSVWASYCTCWKALCENACGEADHQHAECLHRVTAASS